MKKLMKYVVSWSFPAVVLFLVVMGNWSHAASADGGPIMCPPHRPADGGMCDPGKLKDEDTPPIPAPNDAGTPEKKEKVKIKFNGRELIFVPTSGKAVLPDAGKDKPKWLTERRVSVMFTASSIAEGMTDKLKTPVRINNVFFAQGYTEKADAAVIVFATGPISNLEKTHHETAVVLLYSKEEWSVLPTDLLELGPDSM